MRKVEVDLYSKVTMINFDCCLIKYLAVIEVIFLYIVYSVEIIS